MGEINCGLLNYYAGKKFTFYQFSSPANGDRTYSFDVILFSKSYSSFLLLEIIFLEHIKENNRKKSSVLQNKEELKGCGYLYEFQWKEK